MDASQPSPKSAPTKKQLTGLKKRQQIVAANKMIFVWIVVASVAVSTCAVTGQFLFKQLQFNQRVIGAKYEARDTVRQNEANAEELRKAATALIGNDALKSVKSSNDANELQVVFDALPTTADKTAFSSSLQAEILPSAGVSLKELSFQQAVDESGLAIQDQEGGGTTVPFSFEVEGGYDQLKQMFKNLDRTIRPIKVSEVNIRGSDGTLTARVTGVTYYQPAKSIEPTKESIKP